MRIYYVMYADASVCKGPFTFREAVQKQKDLWWPTVILKLVVDENGKEVK